MSSVILTNWTVYYSGDTGGDQQIRWTGTTGTNTVNELYSALQDLFDQSAQMDDGSPMSAQTPTSYTIGKIDAGDKNAWFIDPESIKHLTGGALQTQSWTRSEGSNIGIIKITYSGGTNFVPSDLGKNVTTATDGDSGTLLYYDNTAGEMWVRPDNTDAANSFDASPTANDTISVTSGTGSVTQSAASTTGEMIWSNIFTLGTIESNTYLHLAQNNSIIPNSEDSGGGTWWSTGHIDILIATTDQDTLIDRGLITVYARQYTKKYSYYIADVSAGGRTPIPLATTKDNNNTTGYRQMALTNASAAFTVGEIIQDDSDSTIQGIVTSSDGSAPNITLQYYLIGPSLTDFSASTGSFTGQTSGSTATAVNPTNVGPAAQSMTITFGLDTSLDVDADSTNEDYSIVIDLANTITLADMNERLKYITRRGSTSTLDGIEGQQYLGVDYRVDYNSLTGAIADGSSVTQTLADGTTATSEVVAHSASGKYLILRNTKGTLETGAGANNLAVDGSNYVTMTGSASATSITPTSEHPFGAFAGGKFFGAYGVAVKNVPAADAENYELIDNAGVTHTPPNTVTLTITNTKPGDRVSVFKTTGANTTIDRQMFTLEEVHSSGVSYIRVLPGTIPLDTPDTGTVRVVVRDNNGNIVGEDRYQYTSWVYGTFFDSFTLASTTTRAYDTNDTAYVPYIDEQATGTSITTSLTYVADRNVVTRVRIKGMKPFEVSGQITSTGLTVTTIRTTDSVYQ